MCIWQLNTIQNVVEERKTLQRSNSFSNKLANLTIGKTMRRSKSNDKDKEKKKGLTRSVSFSDFEREERTYSTEIPDDENEVDSSSSDGDLECTLGAPKASFELSPTSVCVDDSSVPVYPAVDLVA